jgi:hypothetical protein
VRRWRVPSGAAWGRYGQCPEDQRLDLEVGPPKWAPSVADEGFLAAFGGRKPGDGGS